MVSRSEKCKGCYPVFKLPSGDIYNILKKNIKCNKDKIVRKNIYEQRIRACELCKGLIANTTCRYSGNLVYQTAIKAKKKCFYPGGSKWCGDK
ncbi:MAG: hypothetical protein ACOCRZ_02255 [Halothermotrichaceae bacterium]